MLGRTSRLSSDSGAIVNAISQRQAEFLTLLMPEICFTPFKMIINSTFVPVPVGAKNIKNML